MKGYITQRLIGSSCDGNQNNIICNSANANSINSTYIITLYKHTPRLLLL